LKQIQDLLEAPNEEEPFSPDITQLYFANRELYNKMAQYYTEKNAARDIWADDGASGI